MGQHYTLGAGPAQITCCPGCTAVAAYVHAFGEQTDKILIARPRLHSMQRG